MGGRSLTLYAAGPALVMMLAMMGGAQHATFRTCLERTVVQARQGGAFGPTKVAQMERALIVSNEWTSAHRLTAKALLDVCNPPKKTSGYERAVIRFLWAQFIWLEPTDTVVIAYVDKARPIEQARLNGTPSQIAD